MGKVHSAPKKQPAYIRSDMSELYEWETYLKGGDDVSLDGVTLCLFDEVKAKVPHERGQCHGSSNNRSIISDCLGQYAFSYNRIDSKDSLARADMLATVAIRWIRQFRTSGGSLVPDA
jgi:hypothetical protein